MTTIEVDQAVAEQARTALDAAGCAKVTVITGDGAAGWPDGAPYDRVIATAAVNTVLYLWVAQTAPGGRLVVPLANTYQAPGVATLTVHTDGTATGGLGASAVFMGLRAQRVPRPRVDFVGASDVDTTTELHHICGPATAARLPRSVSVSAMACTPFTRKPDRPSGHSGCWHPTADLGRPSTSPETSSLRICFAKLDRDGCSTRWLRHTGGGWMPESRASRYGGVTVGPDGQRIELDPGR